MKKFFSTVAMVFVLFGTSLSSNAQMINQVNLESYARQQYGTNWEVAAAQSMTANALNAQGQMTTTKIIEAPGLSKENLYLELTNWFICNYGNAIQYADKEQGVIIARPYLQNITSYSGGFNAYNISINPCVRAQIKDGKVMVTYTLGSYDVEKISGGGSTAKGLAAGLVVASVAGAIAESCDRPSYTEHFHASSRFGHGYVSYTRHYEPRHHMDAAVLASCIAAAAITSKSPNAETWQITACYPFVKDSHKKTSSKAFVMANVYQQVVVNNIEAALTQASMAYNF